MCITVILLISILGYLSWQSSVIAGGADAPKVATAPEPQILEVIEPVVSEFEPLPSPFEFHTFHRLDQNPVVICETISIEEEVNVAPVCVEPIEAVQSSEYPVAAQIWQYMKNLGWNDYVCAGIMGNLMAEVGGQTLNIQYNLYSSGGGYYGMCQWSKKYHSEIYGVNDLNSQCDYLRDTIKYEIDTFGYKYQQGFCLDTFLNLTDAQQAALAFAKTYERCASGSYGIRQQNAIKAYNYFVA